MIETLENSENIVPCEKFKNLIISNNFNTNFSTTIICDSPSMDEEALSALSEVSVSEVSFIENNRKKGNFRQRIRSLREECDDGPLLASAEDLPETDDDSGFVVAHHSKRGKKAKEFVHKEKPSSNLHIFCPNQSLIGTNLNLSRSSTAPETCTQNLFKCLSARYPHMKETEFETLLQMAEKQYVNFKDLSSDEMRKKLDEMKRKQDNCKDKNEDVEKLPSKSAWVEVSKPGCRNRVLDFNECTICFDAWDSDEKIILEECGHCFHSECLRKWMKMKNTCPFCCTYSLSPDDFPKLT